jgi:cytochrome c-type biogenesis protein CcmH
MLALTALLMLPLLLVFFGPAYLRDRRETALAIHRAQLVELDRDLADARIAPAEHAAARLEIERRLLSADSLAEPAMDGNAKLLLLATVIAVPVMAFALYIPGSQPNTPSEPHAAWVAQKQQQNLEQMISLIPNLVDKIKTFPPGSPQASEGQAYLAEILSEEAGTVTPQALALFKQSLATAPADAKWRQLDETRISEAAQQ